MSTPFELPAELTIYGAVETRDALLAWVAEQSAESSSLLEVSAREVAVVDGSGLQLLAALGNMDLPWRLVDISTALSDACRIMGLTTWLEQQQART
jgi:anti-anti-sigma regulatory factor